jgi:hypothetical protein
LRKSQNYKSNTSINNKQNKSIEVLERKHERMNKLNPVRDQDKKNMTAEIGCCNKYNDQYIRGFYTEKASISNENEKRTASSDYKLVARNLNTQVNKRENSQININQQYGSTGYVSNKR